MAGWQLICMGSSTGGTVALESLFRGLPSGLPPIVVVQHMPANFTKPFARRLDGLSPIDVREAEDGQVLTSGCAYLAPGGFHLILERRGAELLARLTTAERVQFQRPSADVLFRSAAEVVGPSVVAVLLTGMGRDGAEGLLALRRVGALTIAQDEASSVVWGMPRVAVELGAAAEVLPLDRIAGRLIGATRAP